MIPEEDDSTDERAVKCEAVVGDGDGHNVNNKANVSRSTSNSGASTAESYYKANGCDTKDDIKVENNISDDDNHNDDNGDDDDYDDGKCYDTVVQTGLHINHLD